MQPLIALVDCNNFYVSCERVFRPDLIGKPVAVLSNNDGCVVARSAEIKKLGVKMGVPVFQIQHLVKQHHIQLLSSNYSYYADMSARVMSTLEEFAPSLETYSIDEAFLDLTGVYFARKTPLLTAIESERPSSRPPAFRSASVWGRLKPLLNWLISPLKSGKRPAAYWICQTLYAGKS